MMKLPKGHLCGSYPPVVTPFKNGEVDYETYARLCEHHVTEGSHGIVVTGTTGEPSTLAVEERIKLAEVAVKTVKGRIPVVAATGSQSHADTVAITKGAEKAGVDALLVVTPYFVRPPARGLVEYYLDIAKRTALPWMIYHIPGRSAVAMAPETIAEIADKADNLVGVKHAVNDLEFVTKVLVRLGMDFRVHVGLEDLSFPMLCVGASGLMNAVGNIQPRKVAELYNKVAAGDLKGARDLHYELFEMNAAVFYDTNPIPMKYMMKRIGLLPNEEHRLPMVPSTPELQRKLDGVLERAGLMKKAAAAE
jgi:4-hydroxy-tetrahydrodipicolinate synthase